MSLLETIICIVFTQEISHSGFYSEYSYAKTSWTVLYRAAHHGSVIQVTQNNFKNIYIFLALLLNEPCSWWLLIAMVTEDGVLPAALGYAHGV